MHGEVLIAILNNQADMEIACEQHWYRIPVEQVEKLKKRHCWAPKWLAFYQTKVFGDEAHKILYYAEVEAVREVYRYELFPQEPRGATSEKRYCKLELSPLQSLPEPIASQQFRRVTFISTTWEKLQTAREITDL
jgi:hypothetical protein